MHEANKRLLSRHFEEVLNEGKLDVIDEIYGDDYVLDAPVQTDGSVAAHGQTLGRDGLKRRVTLFRTAFPDIQFSVENMIAEGDKVVVQYRFRGTHSGNFRELQPTGNKIDVGGILIAQVANDHIESAYSVFDGGDMMHQLTVPEHHHSMLEIFVGTLFEHLHHEN